MPFTPTLIFAALFATIAVKMIFMTRDIRRLEATTIRLVVTIKRLELKASMAFAEARIAKHMASRAAPDADKIAADIQTAVYMMRRDEYRSPRSL